MSHVDALKAKIPILRRWAKKLSLLACLTIGGAVLPVHAAPFEDSMAQRMLACTGCHGAQGRSAPDGYYPRIAGKPAGYLLHQLQNFRDGRRLYKPMTRLLATLDDAYLAEIADYFASLDLPYAAPMPPKGASPQQMALGRQLVEEGDPARDIPACAACHGPRLGGVAPHIPGLLGLPADYLNGQLGAWRHGSRHAAAPDCMADITRRLTAEDIAATSRWLSAQPVIPGKQSLASISELAAKLPMHCGSLDAPRSKPP